MTLNQIKLKEASENYMNEFQVTSFMSRCKNCLHMIDYCNCDNKESEIVMIALRDKNKIYL